MVTVRNADNLVNLGNHQHSMMIMSPYTCVSNCEFGVCALGRQRGDGKRTACVDHFGGVVLLYFSLHRLHHEPLGSRILAFANCNDRYTTVSYLVLHSESSGMWMRVMGSGYI